MKVLKAAVALIGLAGLVAAGIYLGLVYIDNERLLAAANANKSGNLFANPMPHIWLIAGLGAAGGLLLGLGLGLPTRTSGQVRRDALDEVNEARSASIGTRAAERTAIPEGPDGAAPRA